MIHQVEPEDVGDKNEDLGISCKEYVVMIVSDREWYKIGEIQEKQIAYNQNQLDVPDVVVKIDAS